jgi:hypothetical protein
MAARISDESVKTKTGRTWSEWFERLDALGMAQREHREIARHLSDQEGLEPWWAQTVTVEYERARGLRQVHMGSAGEFQASASRTLPHSTTVVFEAWADEEQRTQWLREAITVRKATPGKSLRITWPDASHVDVDLFAKGESKCQVTLGHRKLASADDVAARKAFWKEALDLLAQALERKK